MAKVAMLQCDNCEEATFTKEQPHFRVRAVNKAENKVAVIDLCTGCATDSFGDAIKDKKARATKTTPAPAKATPAKQAQAKAS